MARKLAPKMANRAVRSICGRNACLINWMRSNSRWRAKLAASLPACVGSFYKSVCVGLTFDEERRACFDLGMISLRGIPWWVIAAVGILVGRIESMAAPLSAGVDF